MGPGTGPGDWVQSQVQRDTRLSHQWLQSFYYLRTPPRERDSCHRHVTWSLAIGWAEVCTGLALLPTTNDVTGSRGHLSLYSLSEQSR